MTAAVALRVDRLRYRGLACAIVGECLLRVYAAADGGLPVAVVTELDDNLGPSVTNAIENVHAAVRDGISRAGEPFAFRLVEHYRARGRHPATYDLVGFRIGPLTPRWTHLPHARVEAMIGELPE